MVNKSLSACRFINGLLSKGTPLSAVVAPNFALARRFWALQLPSIICCSGSSAVDGHYYAETDEGDLGICWSVRVGATAASVAEFSRKAGSTSEASRWSERSRIFSSMSRDPPTSTRWDRPTSSRALNREMHSSGVPRTQNRRRKSAGNKSDGCGSSGVRHRRG